MFDQITELIVGAASSPLVYVILFLLCLIDGFFPPVPSETALTAVAAIAATTGNPILALVLITAAAGAVAGDQIAYWLGRCGRLDRLATSRHKKLASTFAWAERQMAKRSASLILIGRYIPVGRVAVNMTAGATRLSYRRFLVFSAIAGVIWSITSVAIALAASSFLHEPIVAAIASMIAAGLVGVIIDRVVAQLRRRQSRRTQVSAPEASHTEDRDRSEVVGPRS